MKNPVDVVRSLRASLGSASRRRSAAMAAFSVLALVTVVFFYSTSSQALIKMRLAMPAAAAAMSQPAAADQLLEGAVLRVPRTGHTATELVDGRVLVVGGTYRASVVDDVEVFDPSNGASSIIG